MTKEPYKKSFFTLKFLILWIFRLWYRPKCVNKNFIPKDGPIIVCGNHIHVLDQCLPISKTNRMLHYMAKKEYFDSKFSLFFKVCGCISVDRENHDENAKNAAIDILNNGFALGIFAEGTRNQVSCKEKEIKSLYVYYKDKMPLKSFIKTLKKNQVRLSQINLLKKLVELKKIKQQDFEENILDPNTYLSKLVDIKVITKEEYQDYLMLDTKFGVVSMAKKTGATVVPYVITGKYKMFSNKLKITFLKPFKVNKDDDLQVKNDYLKGLMTKALYNENKVGKK